MERLDGRLSGARAACFIVPKRGLAERFCEDRAGFVAADGGWRLAVSDGATQSVLARAWAGLLVERYLAAPTQEIDQAWLEPARAGYLAQIRAQLPTMSWHQLEKWQRHGGADATLIGAEVVEGAAGAEVRWVAAGDSLLVAAAGSIRRCPLMAAEDLARRPYLISTRPEMNADLWPQIRRGRFEVPPGGLRLLAVTDAVAAWLLRDPAGAVERLSAVADQAGFEALIGAARDGEGMKDDDCTLLRLEIDPAPEEAEAWADSSAHEMRDAIREGRNIGSRGIEASMAGRRRQPLPAIKQRFHASRYEGVTEPGGGA